MTARLRWSVTRARDADDAWWASWDALNEGNFGRHPTLQARFVRLLVEYFGGPDVLVATLRDHDRARAQAVLGLEGSGRCSVLCPAQSPVGLCVFDRSLGDGRAELKRLFRALPGVTLSISLPYQDPELAWLSTAADRLVSRLTLGTTVAIRSADFDKYWADRPKELRDNVRRRQRRSKEAGLETALVAHGSPDAVAAAVDRYGELESRGWKKNEGTALHPTNHQGKFYREALRAFAATGDAVVYELSLGGALAASRLVLSGPTMHVILKVTHDEELRQYAPGHVQLHEMLKLMLADGTGRSVELYTKASRDWLLWATHTRDIESLTLYRNLLVERLAAFRRRAQARAASAPARQAADATPET